MLFWRSGVYCHFRAIPAAVYLAATVQVIHHSLLGLVELYYVQHTKGQYRGSSEAPENRCSISWSNLVQLYFHEFALYNTSFASFSVSGWFYLSPIFDRCRHNLHNCPAGCWRARNATVIVPELAEIGDNYEFVNQFRPLWSAARAQDVKFCDEKTEQLFLGQQTSQEIVCLIARPS